MQVRIPSMTQNFFWAFNSRNTFFLTLYRVAYFYLLYKYWDIFVWKLRNKIRIRFFSWVVIGHTMFFTCEKYRIANHSADTISFTSDESCIKFSRLRSCSLLTTVSAVSASSRFVQVSVDEFIENQENEKHSRMLHFYRNS